MANVKLSYPVDGHDLTGAGEASAKMKIMLKKIGIPADTIRKASICMYEGEINMVIHADGGTAEVEVSLEEIILTLRDHGPGIPDVGKAMQEGWSTAGEAARDLGFGAGMGLPNMKKNSDQMQIETTVGVGTTVTMKIRL